MPPRWPPVSRTRSTSSSPAIPRRRRWAAKSKRRVRVRSRAAQAAGKRSSAPIAVRAGSAGRAPRSGTAAGRERPASGPVAMRASAEAPKADGRGCVRRCARALIGRPSPIRPEAWSSARRRASPTALPASSRAAATTASRGARSQCRAGEQRRAATRGRAELRLGEREAERRAKPTATCQGRLAGERGRRLGARSRLERFAQGREPLLADALDLRELGQRAEAAVGVAVLDDALRERRADAVDAVELLDRGGREVDPVAARWAARSAGGAAPATRPPPGTTICWPSARRAARFTVVRSARGLGPPARWSATGHARPGRQPHQPRPADGARHVHVDAAASPRAARRSGDRRRRGRGRRRLGRRPRMPHAPRRSPAPRR